MEFLSSLFYFIIVIGVLVVIHEFGHFIAARMTGMRADIFSVGMGNRMLGYNKITGFTFGPLMKDFDGGGHTDYRLSLFPIGGYVKVAGMVDESLDTGFADQEAQPWEFRSKGFWAKAFVLSAGVIMNVLFAIMIFAGKAYFEGDDILKTNTVGSVKENTIAYDAGFLAGDKILSINDNTVETWSDFQDNLIIDDFGNDKVIKVLRNGNEIKIHIDGKKIIDLLSNKATLGIIPGETYTYLTSISESGSANKIGLFAGDTILSVNQIKINTASLFKEILQANKSIPLLIEWKRGNQVYQDSITPSSAGLIGVGLGFGPTIKKTYGIFASIEYGTIKSFETVNLLFSTISNIFSGKSSFKDSFGGPIMIAKQASMSADMGISAFMFFMAMLSMSLAFINILPFPALDGGHLVFVTIEAIFKREVPLKLKMAIQQGGFFILIAFMLYIVYIDLVR